MFTYVCDDVDDDDDDDDDPLLLSRCHALPCRLTD